MATNEEKRLDAMIAAASAEYDKGLLGIVKETSELSEQETNEIAGKWCSDVMRESLPPTDTPNTTEDGLPRVITISSLYL